MFFLACCPLFVVEILVAKVVIIRAVIVEVIVLMGVFFRLTAMAMSLLVIAITAIMNGWCVVGLLLLLDLVIGLVVFVLVLAVLVYHASQCWHCY